MDFVFFKQKAAYEMRISDWSSDVCSSDLMVGYATCSSHPTPQLQELATTTSIRSLPRTPAQTEIVVKNDPSSSPITIAKGTYKGVDVDVPTVGVPEIGRASCRERVCQ